MNLQSLQNLFPKSRKNGATTGNIPMSFLVANEQAIAKIVKEEKLRRIYRGPRGVYDDQSFTHKADATAVLLYRT
jgi:hypothetical protein